MKDSIVCYQIGGNAMLYQFVPPLKEDNRTYAISYLGANLIAKWTIKLK